MTDKGGGSFVENRNALWSDTLEKVRAEIGDTVFNMWLRNTVLIRLDDEVLELGVPTTFARVYIAGKLAGVISKHLYATAKKKPLLRMSINGHLHKKIREAQAGAEEPVNYEAPPAPKKKKSKTDIFTLNPTYKFDNFITGPSNKLAFDSAVKVANHPAKIYNPLFIFGGYGLGKTHLLQGIAEKTLAENPSFDVFYVTGDYFINQFVSSLTNGTIDKFRARIRGCDMLIIDDVHILARKAASQEEFLQCFNALEGSAKQIVMASDAHPRSIEKLRDELCSRFVSGMLIEIETLDFSTKLALIDNFLHSHQKTLSKQIREFLAENLPSNAREIKGAIIRLLALISITDETQVNIPMVRQALKDFIFLGNQHLSLSDIENAVISHLNVTSEQLHAKTRIGKIVFARQVIMSLAREMTDLSLNEIAEFFKMNHANVLYADRRIKEQAKTEIETRNLLEKLRRDLRCN
ncbi:MAG: chromosomal replication initiator protein DnaA [Planctomycetes bacterium]|nr:chromosomal replication initiator protein DnaA [Planctomycetota bacterium]